MPPTTPAHTRCPGRPWMLPSLEHVTPSAAHVPCGVARVFPNLRHFATLSADLELRPLPSSSVTRTPRYCGPLRHPIAPCLTVTGLVLVVTTDHAIGLPVLPALSLCTCHRHYPGAAIEAVPRSFSPTVSAFPDMAVGSACASTFSRLARRSLSLRPAHSRCHRIS